MVNEMPSSWEFAWAGKAGKFHRTKKAMTTTEELSRAVDYHMCKGDACYRTVYKFANFKNKNSCIVDRIYIDLDNETYPQIAMDDAARIGHYFDGHTTQWFSGKKGIGMEVLCNTAPLLPEMKRDVLRRWTHAVIRELGITTADAAVIGDINRVHRIVDTVHQDTGLHAIGLSQSELTSLSIEDVKAMATSPRELVPDATPSMDVTDSLMRAEETILIERLQRFVGRKMLAQTTFDSIVENMTIDSRNTVFEFIQSLDDEYQYRVAKNAPRSGYKNWWIAEAEEKLRSDGQLTDGKDRGLEHKKRVHFVKFAHRCGMSFREICNAFVNVVDGNGKRCYDAAMTESQVRSCIR